MFSFFQYIHFGGATERAMTGPKWDRRYFKLRSDAHLAALQYFTSEDATQPQHSVALADITGVRAWSHETTSSSGDRGGAWQPPYETRFEVFIALGAFQDVVLASRIPDPPDV